jgi:hypothetical protein
MLMAIFIIGLVLTVAGVAHQATYHRAGRERLRRVEQKLDLMLAERGIEYLPQSPRA